MEKRDYAGQERLCQIRYMEAGSCFHVCSGENHPVIFHNEKEFKTAMNTIAFVAFLFDDVRIYTFEVMSNHLHFAISGEIERIERCMHVLVTKLAADPALANSSTYIRALSFKYIPVNGLDNLRNVISYVNRNGFVVNPAHSPFSYPWGANRYFYNPEAKLRLQACGQKANYITKRDLFHSNRLAKETSVIVLDGYVSPASFCHIEEAESFFHSCWHYFNHVSRKVEAAKDIAKEIGESLFYNDEELFAVVASHCAKTYGRPSPTTLSKSEKLDVGRMLHHDYNATNRQISRLLKIDLDTVNLLFPLRPA